MRVPPPRAGPLDGRTSEMMRVLYCRKAESSPTRSGEYCCAFSETRSGLCASVAEVPARGEGGAMHSTSFVMLVITAGTTASPKMHERFDACAQRLAPRNLTCVPP